LLYLKRITWGLLAVIFFVAGVLYGMQEALKPGRLFYNTQALKRVFIPSKAVPLAPDAGTQRFYGNDFFLEMHRVDSLGNPKKTGGLLFDSAGKLSVFEQSEAQSLLGVYGASKVLQDAIIGTNENGGFDGGLKKSFYFKGDAFFYLGLRSKNDKECFFTSIVNVSKNFEVFRGPCIPNPEAVDFNGSGGGNAILNDQLYFALGAPSVNGVETERLAQDMTSPYGKVLVFQEEQLLNQPPDKFAFTIFSSGHRNMQGMVNAGGSLYGVEHGPKGGDEINLLVEGGDYGWPKFSLGSTYSYGRIQFQGTPYDTVGADPYINPLFSFIPSVATSDITNCPKALQRRYDPLRCILLSSLRATSIFVVLVEETANRVVSVERINIGMRVREFSKDKAHNLHVSTDSFGVFEIKFKNVAAK
jgi:hypothetical protein